MVLSPTLDRKLSSAPSQFSQLADTLMREVRQMVEAELQSLRDENANLRRERLDLQTRNQELETELDEAAQKALRFEREIAKYKAEAEHQEDLTLVVQALEAEKRRLIQDKVQLAQQIQNQPVQQTGFNLGKYLKEISPNSYKAAYLALLKAIARVTGEQWQNVPKFFGSYVPERLEKILCQPEVKPISVTGSVLTSVLKLAASPAPP